MPAEFIVPEPPAKILENDDILFANAVGRFMGRLIYTSSGTFAKADYPFARQIDVTVIGGGGGGGGTSTTGSNTNSISGPGGGGSFSRSFLNLQDVTANASVIVGAGGAGGAPGNNNGVNGGTSFFAALMTAPGGSGGTGRVALTGARAGGIPGSGGAPGTGNLTGRGGTGTQGMSLVIHTVVVATSGATFFGGGRIGRLNNTAFDGAGGSGGGMVGLTANQTGRAGGNGGAGIVIVDLYA